MSSQLSSFRALRGAGLALLLTTSSWAADSIGFFSPQAEVVESDGSVVFAVRRTGTGVGAISVDYATVNGPFPAASAGSDYTAISGTLTWNDGDLADQHLTVPILDDATYENFEYFRLQLSNPTGGATVSTPSQQIMIQDDDPNPAGTITVLTTNPSASVVVGEGAGSVVLTAIRSGGSTGIVTADFSFSGGSSATPGSDYTVPGSMTLTWANGDTAPKTLVIPIVDDSLPEVDESFGLYISGTTGGASVGFPDGLNVTIIDDDPPVAGALSIPTSLLYAVENQGSLVIPVGRVGGSTGAVTIDYATADFDALDGVDYTGVSGTLSWADGDAAPKTVTIPILDDSVPELTKSLTLGFSNPTGGLLTPALPFIDVRILDDDTAAGVLGLTSFEATCNEGDGALVLTVQRRGGAIGAVSVDYATSDGSATSPADFTAVSGTLNWADGDSSPKSITIPLIEDAIPEGQENFSLTLSNEVGALLDPAGAFVDIAMFDDDVDPAGVLSMAADNLTVSEGAGSVDFVVHRTGGSTGAIAVRWDITSRYATNPEDFTGPMVGTLAWADGDTADKTVTVPIVDDAVAEGLESFTFHVGLPSNGATILGSYIAVCTIVDDDAAIAGRLSFTKSTTSVGEADGTATFAVRRIGGATGAITVDYATAWIGAIAPAFPGVDYLSTNGTLSWADGDTADKTFTVAIIDDSLQRPSRDFLVRLSAPTGGAVLDTATTSPTADCWIVDDDTTAAGAIGFTAITKRVAEDAGTATLTVARQGGTTGAVSVAYTTEAGTAMAGGDFVAVSGVLTWSDGDGSSRTITVPLVDDAVVEGDETFLVELSAPTNGSMLLASTATVTIVDDEANPAGTIEFRSATRTISEAAGTVGIAVRRRGGATGIVSASYSIADVSTLAGADYVVVAGGTLTWNNGDAADQKIDLTPIADHVPEGHETLRLTLSTPTGGATIGRDSEDVVIADPVASSSGGHHGCGMGFGISGIGLALGLQVLRARSGTSRWRR